MRPTTHILAGLSGLAAAATLALASASAADYFAGKSIDLLIGAPPGGGYDIYARALARHFGRHIPGQPTIVSKNMPGAGSARAAGFISTIAPKDGTAIAAIMPGAIMGPLLDEKAEALFDPTKVHYLGTANNGTRVCVRSSGIQDQELRRRAHAEGGRSAASRPTIPPTNTATCTSTPPARNTTWCPATAARPRSRSRWSAARSTAPAAGTGRASSRRRPDWLRDNKVNVLLQVGLEPNAELTRMGVPSVFKYVKSEDDRKVVELVISQQVFQRSYIAPPGIPAEQLATLRSAFDATMSDQAVPRRRRQAAHRHLALARRQGAGAGAEAHAAPKDVVERARQAISAVGADGAGKTDVEAIVGARRAAAAAVRA